MVRQLSLGRYWYSVIILSGLLCFIATKSQAQSYRVYRPIPQVYEEKRATAPSLSLFEIDAAGVLSAGEIQDKENNSISRAMRGWQLRGFFHFNDIIAAGLAVEQLKSADMKTKALTAFERNEWEALLSVVLTPNTEPQLYLLAGIGQASQQSRFKRQHRDFNQKSLVLVAGIGGKVRLWKDLFLFGDYVIHYDRKKWDNFLFEGPHIRQEVTAGLGYRF